MSVHLGQVPGHPDESPRSMVVSHFARIRHCCLLQTASQRVVLRTLVRLLFLPPGGPTGRAEGLKAACGSAGFSFEQCQRSASGACVDQLSKRNQLPRR